MPDSQAKEIAHAVEVALLKQTVENNEKAVSELAIAVRDLTALVTAMSATIAEARGGWRVLMLLGGAAAVMGSGLTWFLTHVKFS